MRSIIVVFAIVFLGACARPAAAPGPVNPQGRTGPVAYPPNQAEPHLANLRMLTRGGENAEAYFSPDGEHLIFQATWPGLSECDQIYIMDVAGRNPHRVSDGKGRTTCGYFFHDGKRVLYASTEAASPDCPPRPDYSQGYVWALYDYDIYTARPDGSDTRVLFRSPAYDAEATLSTDGRKIVFTSMRDGDLDIYTMDADGSNVRKLTDELGYDGGPFFSPDGTKIIYRAYHPKTVDQIADYRRLLGQGLVRPTTMELWVMDADGSNKHQVTHNGAANFAPYFHPDGKRVIFASNMADPTGRDFDIYIIGLDGSGLERITNSPEFDGFPMFSPDGRRLVFASNRGDAHRGETNVFIADWIEHPVSAGNNLH
jgi:Tol biopolymer transport system component